MSKGPLTGLRSEQVRRAFVSAAFGHLHPVEHRLPHDVASASRSRQLVTDAAKGRLPQARLDELALAVTEVVGNAVRHAPPEPDGKIGLRIEQDPGVLRVPVTDGGPEFRLDGASLKDTLRRDRFGFLIVDALADRWGLALDGKKAVWLEVDVPLDRRPQGTSRSTTRAAATQAKGAS